MTSAIVACARGYLGTRFQHQGRLKKTPTHKGGIDCLGLLACVAGELGLTDKTGQPLSSFDSRDYAHRPDAAKLRAQLEALLETVAIESMKEGDILLLEVDGAHQHLGIASQINVYDDRQEFAGPPANMPHSENGEEVYISVHDRVAAQEWAYAARPSRINGIIHAYAPARAVVEHALDAYWRSKIIAVYRIHSCQQASWPAMSCDAHPM